MSNTTEENIKLALKKHIEENNVSLKYIAEKAGQTVAAVKTVLSPSSRGPALAYRAIAEILGLDYKELREANLSDEIKEIANRTFIEPVPELVEALSLAGRLAGDYTLNGRLYTAECWYMGLNIKGTAKTGGIVLNETETIAWLSLSKVKDPRGLIKLTFEKISISLDKAVERENKKLGV